MISGINEFDRLRLPHAKGDIGIILPDEQESKYLVVEPKNFLTRLKERLFGPRQPPIFYLGLRKSPDSVVEIESIRRVQPRDDPSGWTCLNISFRFVEKGGK